MFGTSKKITIKVKLYGGLDRRAGIEPYDPEAGIELQVGKNTKIRRVLRSLGLGRHETMVFFVNGRKAGPSQSRKNSISTSTSV